jgi:hypothetical protein
VRGQNVYQLTPRRQRKIKRQARLAAKGKSDGKSLTSTPNLKDDQSIVLSPLGKILFGKFLPLGCISKFHHFFGRQDLPLLESANFSLLASNF